MAFHFKCNRQIVTDVNKTGIFFACIHKETTTRSRQLFQFKDRIFVARMFGPHDRKNAQLGPGRHPAKNLLDTAVLLVRNSKCRGDFKGNVGITWIGDR